MQPGNFVNKETTAGFLTVVSLLNKQSSLLMPAPSSTAHVPFAIIGRNERFRPADFKSCETRVESVLFLQNPEAPLIQKGIQDEIRLYSYRETSRRVVDRMGGRSTRG